jgi:hypothetical protein
MDADEFIRARPEQYQKDKDGITGQDQSGYQEYQPTIYQKEAPMRSVNEELVRGLLMGWLGNVAGVPDAVAIRRLHPSMHDGDDYHPEKVHHTRLGKLFIFYQTENAKKSTTRNSQTFHRIYTKRRRSKSACGNEATQARWIAQEIV